MKGIMQNRMVMLAVIIGIAAVSMVGIGYAYTAMTISEDNSVDVAYLTITPSDGTNAVYSGSFSENVYFDTQTVLTDKGQEADPRYVQEVIYSLADGTFETIGGHEYSSLGVLYLTVNETKSTDDYKVAVTVDDGDGLNTTDFSYYVFFQIGSADSYDDAKTAAEADTGSFVQMTLSSGDMVAQTSTITNDEDNTHTVVLVTVYVGMNGGDSITRPLSSLLDTEVLDEVSFRFTAIAE